MSGEHRWNDRAGRVPPARLRLYPNRAPAAFAGAFKQLSPDRGQCSFRCDAPSPSTPHAVNGPMPFGAHVLVPCLPQILTLDNRFQRRSTIEPPAFDIRSSRAAIRFSWTEVIGVHPRVRCPSSARPDSSAARLARKSRYTGHSTVRAFGRTLPPTMPSANSPPRVTGLATRLSSGFPGRAEISRVRPTAFTATSVGLPPSP